MRRKPILTTKTIAAISRSFEEHKIGIVRTPDFVLVSSPAAPRGYILKYRSVIPKIPNN